MSIESDYKMEYEAEKKTDFVKVAKSSSFKQLIKARKKFIVPLTIFFFIFYFMLPVLTSYTTFMNAMAIGDISWAWIYAFAQFVMTWILCIVYVKKSASFDKQSNQIIEEQLKKEE
ncbi:DUF485 domain-containing protein [Virgibacillus sp. NKC19-3]|uniref:DUF485 domain-containing protein n=1 Tax=Virgibacillus saliphilus TaxID=2831674 RepID=UPI001C9A7723|nr:DUF485 domain-containing protein [Virgibacillus sp. NKC19-3]MBY7144081.1 DUF485 domain-containing protein [Virgibacillus sp. NKC19-3]